MQAKTRKQTKRFSTAQKHARASTSTKPASRGELIATGESVVQLAAERSRPSSIATSGAQRDLPTLDYDAILEAIETYQACIPTHTVPHGTGRRIATIGAARALSLAFRTMKGRVQPALDNLLWDGDGPPALADGEVVVGPRTHVDVGDPEAVYRAELLEALIDVVAFPIERHNEQTLSPAHLQQRFFAQDLLDEAMLGAIECVRRLVQLRSAAAHAAPTAQPKAPKPMKRAARRRRLAQEQNVDELSDALTDLQASILGALFAADARSRGSRLSKAELCRDHLDDDDPKRLVHVLKELVDMKLIRSLSGRSGGYWIDALGEQVHSRRIRSGR